MFSYKKNNELMLSCQIMIDIMLLDASITLDWKLHGIISVFDQTIILTMFFVFMKNPGKVTCSIQHIFSECNCDKFSTRLQLIKKKTIIIKRVS